MDCQIFVFNHLTQTFYHRNNLLSTTKNFLLATFCEKSNAQKDEED
jgi:hypothetical protein